MSMLPAFDIAEPVTAEEAVAAEVNPYRRQLSGRRH